MFPQLLTILVFTTGVTGLDNFNYEKHKNQRWVGHDLMTLYNKSVVQCSRECTANKDCNSFDFLKIKEPTGCELKSGWCLPEFTPPLVADSTRNHHRQKYPIFRSCRIYKEKCPASTTKNYTINPDGTTDKFDVYCDMDSNGGEGWTLVYVYTFTNYANFHLNDGSNSVTPCATFTDIDRSPSIPISTTPPAGPTDLGAVDFVKYWGGIGDTVILKSNINNMLKCSPGTGNVPKNIEGTLSCTILDDTVVPCPSGTVQIPDSWGRGESGPVFIKQVANVWPIMYVLECNDVNLERWPAHDPCGRAEPNQKQGVAFPYGSVYIH